jgi:hypothetical protein
MGCGPTLLLQIFWRALMSGGFLYSRSRNRDLDSKNILTRPGIPGLERKSGYQITRVGISYITDQLHRERKHDHQIQVSSRSRSPVDDDRD